MICNSVLSERINDGRLLLKRSTRTPKTNGMVGRFNGRIADVLKTNCLIRAKEMAQTLTRYVALYNHLVNFYWVVK